MDKGLGTSELSRLKAGAFKISPLYDSDADTLTLFIRDDESYRERIDSLLTVYRSFATDQVVGCHIKGIKRILKAVSVFDLGIHGANVRIGLILMGIPWAEHKAEASVLSQRYVEIVRPIIEQIGDRPLDLPASELAGTLT